MKTLKLHAALKLKNRLAGEVARLQRLIVRENSRRNDNSSKVDVADLLIQLDKTRANLAAVKGALAAANVPIYDKLAALSEAKGHMAYLSTIPTREGEEKAAVGYKGDVQTYQWTAHLNQAAIDKALVDQQDVINRLQDEIDAFNANASISVTLA
jgi:hypothetical protein